MDEYRPKRPKDTDVPIIGDYSEAANERIRSDVQHRSDTRIDAAPRHDREPDPNAPTAAQRARAANRAAGEQWALDPADVRRHAKLARQRDSVGPLGKVMRYGLVVVVLAAAAAVYWNFETLRGVTIDVSALTSLFTNKAGSSASGTAASNGAPETIKVEAPAVAGTDVPASVGDLPPAASNTATAPSAPAAATANAPTSSAAVAVGEPATNEATAAVEPPRATAAEPPPAPEPPPEPETFSFGIPVVNVSEADASAAILILRNGDRRRASSVVWWTKDGTATAGSDYADLGKVTVKFAPGEQNRTIRIPIVSDGKVEGRESFYVSLATSDAAIAAGEATEEVEVVINDQN